MKNKQAQKNGWEFLKPSLPIVVTIIFLTGLFLVEITSLKSFTQPQSATTQALITKKSFLPISDLITTKPITPKPTATPTKPPVILGNQLKVPILMYHYIGNNPDPKDLARDSLSVSPDKFDEQMQYLSKSGFTTITLGDLYSGLKKVTSLPVKPIILTFDDGYADFYHNAYPILQKYSFKATVFIPTGLMEKNPYLNWDQIKQMSSSGSISFEAHTVSHAYLTALSNSDASREISESKKVLEEKLGVKSNFISYPFGASDGRIQSLAKNAGYIGGVGTWASNIQSEGMIYNSPRLRINNYVTLENFIKLVN